MCHRHHHHQPSLKPNVSERIERERRRGKKDISRNDDIKIKAIFQLPFSFFFLWKQHHHYYHPQQSRRSWKKLLLGFLFSAVYVTQQQRMLRKTIPSSQFLSRTILIVCCFTVSFPGSALFPRFRFFCTWFCKKQLTTRREATRKIIEKGI